MQDAGKDGGTRRYNIYTTIKPRTSINRVIRVNGKNLQYTVFRLGDNNLNVGRIHEK